MKVLFDTNVVLDVMLDRKPFVKVAAQLFSRVETGGITGFLGATTITTIHYLATRTVGSNQALIEIGKLFKLFEIAPVNRAVLESAILLRFSDFEDAVLHEAAYHVGVDSIVTRDLKGFEQSLLSVYSPEELTKILNEKKNVTT